MVELAEAFTGMVTHADWAMFCKNGTDATSMAMVTARCADQEEDHRPGQGAPITAPRPGARPRPTRHHQGGQGQPGLLRLQRHRQPGGRRGGGEGDDLAAIFAAPFKHDAFIDQAMPDPAYARRARELCDERGALLGGGRCASRVSRGAGTVRGSAVRREAGPLYLGQVHR